MTVWFSFISLVTICLQYTQWANHCLVTMALSLLWGQWYISRRMPTNILWQYNIWLQETDDCYQNVYLKWSWVVITHSLFLKIIPMLFIKNVTSFCPIFCLNVLLSPPMVCMNFVLKDKVLLSPNLFFGYLWHVTRIYLSTLVFRYFVDIQFTVKLLYNWTFTLDKW
jgi:hypothetical protein